MHVGIRSAIPTVLPFSALIMSMTHSSSPLHHQHQGSKVVFLLPLVYGLHLRTSELKSNFSLNVVSYLNVIVSRACLNCLIAPTTTFC